MDTKPIKPILKRNAQLQTLITQGQFLTGYTNGGGTGVLISIFLCKSPWSGNCIKATACEYIPAGQVFVVSDEQKWSLIGKWKAYSPIT